MVVYNPTPDQDMTLTLDAQASRADQTLHLRAGSEELARRDLGPKGLRHCVRLPFRLPAGLHELTIESESPGRDVPDRKTSGRGSKKPRRMLLARVSLSNDNSPEPAPVAARERVAPAAQDTITR
jgi:hypothetical protein